MPVRFKILVQIAGARRSVDDATKHWPESANSSSSALSSSTLRVPDDNLSQQKHIIFDPIPRVEGIEPSADPLLELRAAIYLLSGRRRRAAKMEEPRRIVLLSVLL